MQTILVNLQYLDGRPLFEVPIDEGGASRTPRCPVSGWTAFYTPDYSRCMLAVGDGAEHYLEQRKYARRVGVAKYDPAGMSHVELDPTLLDNHNG